MTSKRLAIVLTLAAWLGPAAQDVPSPFPAYDRAPDAADVTVRSVYVAMRDGVRLAVDVALPAGLAAGAKLPAILMMTPYWRAGEGQDAGTTVRFFATRGYAVVRADVRGTGASFGVWRGPQSADEVGDGGDLVAWIAGQPWSNARVGAMGISYEGTTAQMLAASGRPEVLAVIPKFHEFDLFTDIAYPGGLLDEGMVRDWSAGMQQLAKGAGVKRVDEDADGRLLAQAVADHARNLDIFAAAKDVDARDDRPAAVGVSLDDLSVFSHRARIERAKTAIYGWGSWMDAATADTCIRRFLNFDNPQLEIVGAWSHGASYDADPFHPADAPPAPSRRAQLFEDLRYFDRHLKNLGPPALPRSFTYYVMGAGTWKTTDVWPIAGTKRERWHLQAEHGLGTAAPAASEGADTYTVDFSATTGTRNRWHTENGGGDVVYSDRAEQDRRLLTYTSAPMAEDVEITGYPIVSLSIASTATDGAFFVYLEDVDEAGRVVYVTEGQLRALYRKIADAPPFKTLVPYHSFARRDAEPLVPGQPVRLDFGMLPTSVVVRAGHRIRVAIAGSDKDTFVRLPAAGTPEITVFRNRAEASFVELPVVARGRLMKTETPPAASREPSPAPATSAAGPMPAALTTVDAVLDAYVAALGGRDAILAKTSRIGKGTFSVPDKNFKRPMEVYAKAPNKRTLRIEGTEHLLGSGFDGEIGWDWDFTGVGLRRFEGAQAAGLKRQTDFYRELHYREIYPTMTLKGIEMVDGREAYVIEGTPATGRPVRLYFDRRSALLFRSDTLAADPSAPPGTIAYFDDYRTVDGVKLPFLVRNVVAGGTGNVFTYDSYRFNVQIDDKVFAVPRSPR
jgi:uncharacterized protein